VIYAAIVLALIITLLAIPFEIIFQLQREKAFHSDVEVRWLFGVVRFAVPGKSTQKPDKRPAKVEKKAKKQKKANKKSTNGKAIKNLLWNARFRYRAIKFVKAMFKSIQIATLYIHIRLGLDDPADTGRLWALLGPLAVFLSNVSSARITLEPDFQAESVYLDGRGRVRIVPLQVIFTVLAFVFSPITISAMWKAFGSSK
jgi:hypothetical protein